MEFCRSEGKSFHLKLRMHEIPVTLIIVDIKAIGPKRPVASKPTQAYTMYPVDN
jgi:hypothetical protein